MKALMMGAAMAAMMLFMLHDPLMSGGLSGLVAGAGFVLAHVAVLLGIAGCVLFFPNLRARILAHRPDSRHVALMFVGLVGMGAVIHGIMHGGLT